MLNKDKSNQNEKTRNRTRYLLKEKSMKNILKVRMLGGFTLEYKGKELVLDRNNVSKTTQLFQLLLLHTQDGGISKAALIDALYGRSDVENKNGSLNNTIFRLRKQLTAAGLPESSYININGGMCTWDPDMMGEDWAAVENIACRDMYFDCVEELCHYLKTEEKFEELYRVAHSAAEIYPFYDWQIWEIDSLIGMSRYKDGLDVYKRTTKLMFDELGLSPSAGMLERFKLMGERTSQAAGAIEDIKYRLREKESIEGAYYCTYPSFVDVYHVFGRMMERTGMSVFLMLCTLDFINIETDDENQKYYSELLRESIQKAVRKGDFYTRYNIQQYIVMLIGITQENCTLVSKRINKEFNKRLTRRKNVSIDYYVASLGEVCDTETTNNDRRTS